MELKEGNFPTRKFKEPIPGITWAFEYWLSWLENLNRLWYKHNCIIVLSQVLGTSSLNHHVATEMLNLNEKKIIRQMKSDNIQLVNEIVYHWLQSRMFNQLFSTNLLNSKPF